MQQFLGFLVDLVHRGRRGGRGGRGTGSGAGSGAGSHRMFTRFHVDKLANEFLIQASLDIFHGTHEANALFVGLQQVDEAFLGFNFSH